jgi:hypothetical protein
MVPSCGELKPLAQELWEADLPVVNTSSVEQDDLGSSFNQPSTVDELDTTLLHGVESDGQGSAGRTTEAIS